MSNSDKLDYTAHYRIYIVNETAANHKFWCFLQEPQDFSLNQAYANSAASMNVKAHSSGKDNCFTIPVQYALGVGVGNQPIGLDVKVVPNSIENVDMKQLWEAEYATAPPCNPPRLELKSEEESPPGTVTVATNAFNKQRNENEHCFSNMSYGIPSNNGFMGFTWSPLPSMNYMIRPKFAFYIATGAYQSNHLYDIQSIAREAALVQLSEFQYADVTVTLAADGTWLVTPGEPS